MDKKTSSYVCLTVVFCWLMLAGQPQYILYGGTLAVIISIQSTRSSRLGTLGKLFVAGVLAVGCAAVLIIPAGYFIMQSDRADGLSKTMFLLDSLDCETFVGLLAPLTIIKSIDEGDINVLRIWTKLHFIGSVPVMAAIGALLIDYRRREVHQAVSLILIGVFLAALPWLPVLGGLAMHVPPFSLIRHSAWWLFLVDFGLVWMAALCVSAIEDRKINFRKKSPLRFFTILSGLYFTLTLVPFLPDGWRMSVIALTKSLITLKFHAFIQPLVVSAVCAVGIWLVRERRGAQAYLISLLIAGTYLELLFVGFLAQPNTKLKWLMEPTHAEEIITREYERDDWFRVYVIPPSISNTWIFGHSEYEVVTKMRIAMRNNIPAISGIMTIGGSNPLKLNGVEKRLSNIVSSGSEYHVQAEALRACGVRYVIADNQIPSNRSLVYDGHVKLYSISATESPVKIIPENAGRVISAESSAAGVWSVEVTLDSPANVVISESYAPGWRLLYEDELNKEMKLVPSKASFLSFSLPKGVHRCKLIYDPTSVRVGFIGSIVFLSVMAMGGVMLVRRKP